MTIDVHLSRNGWILSNGEKQAGPFTSSNEIDVSDTAKHLSCDPKEILEVEMRMGKYTKMADVPIPDKVNESELTWKDLKKLNPALDIFESRNPGTFLCTLIPLSCMVQKKKDETKLEEKILPHIVLSNRQAYVASPNWFQNRGVSHVGKIEMPPLRWSIDGFRSWKHYGRAIDKKEIYYKIKQAMEYYIDCVDAGTYWYIPLWIIGTYFHHLFETYPLVGLTGTKRSGKTKICRFVFVLGFNAEFSVSMSESRMFRVAEALRATIILDEAEEMSSPDKKQAQRRLLNSSYENGATVDITNKNTNEGDKFSTFGPRILAAIQGYENVLEDRTIVFVMLRTGGTRADLEIKIKDQLWQDIRDDLYILMMDNWQEIKEIYERMETHPDIHGRDWQLWRPIFAIAEWLGPKIKSQMYVLATRKMAFHKDKDQYEADEMLLLKILKEGTKEDRWWSMSDIKSDMENEYEEDHIPQKLAQEGTTYVRKLLERLNWSERRKDGRSWQYHILVDEVKDRCKRYGIQDDKKAVQRKLPTD